MRIQKHARQQCAMKAPCKLRMSQLAGLLLSFLAQAEKPTNYNEFFAAAERTFRAAHKI